MKKGVGWEARGDVRCESDGNRTELIEVFDARQRGSGIDEAGVAHRVDDGIGISDVALTEEHADGIRGFAAELGGRECGLLGSICWGRLKGR
jgi:hypothetical protein